jgi:hypothetical protein
MPAGRITRMHPASASRGRKWLTIRQQCKRRAMIGATIYVVESSLFI